jgi:hypothetical protein
MDKGLDLMYSMVTFTTIGVETDPDTSPQCDFFQFEIPVEELGVEQRMRSSLPACGRNI